MRKTCLILDSRSRLLPLQMREAIRAAVVIGTLTGVISTRLRRSSHLLSSHNNQFLRINFLLSSQLLSKFSLNLQLRVGTCLTTFLMHHLSHNHNQSRPSQPLQAASCPTKVDSSLNQCNVKTRTWTIHSTKWWLRCSNQPSLHQVWCLKVQVAP